MAVKTTSPEAGQLVTTGPVGSMDDVRTSDYRFLDVRLPPEVARLKDGGDLDGARDACRALLDGDPEPELAACLRVELHRMGRMRRQFCVTRSRALELMRSEWPEFTEPELDDLISRKRIDWRYIDREQMLLGNFLDSLRVYPSEVPGLDREPEPDTSVRDAMLQEMRERGHAARVVTARASISVPGAQPGEVVRAWLPIPARAPQQSDIEILEMTEGGSVASDSAAARTVFWESENLREFCVTYRYRIDAPYVDTTSPAPARHAVDAPAPCAEDLSEQRPHILFTPALRSLTAAVTGGIAAPMERARAIYDYLTRNVDYRYQPDYAQLDAIADSCAKSLRGDCGVMALTFIAMCRIAGIPARWQSGLYVSPDYIGPHDWAMFYTDEYGWLWADVSFGSSSRRAGNESRRLHHFGNLDPWRMVANRCFQAEFEQGPGAVRWDPYDNQLGEASVDGRGCDETEMLREIELIEMRDA